MFRKSIRKDTRRTAPDHRPMLPVFRTPGDPVDAAIREARRCYDLNDPREYLKWR